MKKLSLTHMLCLVLMVFVVCPSFAQNVLWYGDPNNSVNSNFRRFDSGNAGDNCSNQSNNGSYVTTPNDGQYGKVWRITKPTGQKRGEFARTKYIPQDGQTLYYGWRWKITSNTPISGGVAVWQWKTDAGNQDNTQNYPLNMGYGNGKLTLSAWGPCFPTWNSCSGSISKRKTTLWSKSVSEGTWVSIVLKIKLSRNDNNGYVEFWFNGEKQTLSNSDYQQYQATISSDGKRAYHKTMDGTEVYPKWGSYNSNSCNYSINTYYDEMRIATTLSAATPSGTTTSPPGGVGLESLYLFKNVATGRYLDSNGASLVTSNSSSGSDKRWALVATDNGYYNIDSYYNGRGVLDSEPNKVVIGSNVQPNTSGSKNNDREWIPEPLGNNIYRFKNRVTGRDYLAERTNNNTIEYTSWNGSRSQWELINISNKGLTDNNFESNTEVTNAPESNIRIFPIPAKNHFTIDIGTLKSAKITILSVTGQKIFETKTIERQFKIENQGVFESGLYMVQVTGEDGSSKTLKLIFE